MGRCPADPSEGLCSQKQDSNLEGCVWELLRCPAVTCIPLIGRLQNKCVVSDREEHLSSAQGNWLGKVRHVVAIGIFGISIKLFRKHEGSCVFFQSFVLLYTCNVGTELSQHKKTLMVTNRYFLRTFKKFLRVRLETLVGGQRQI